MESAAFRGLHGGLEGGHSGQYDHLTVRPLLLNDRQQVEAMTIRQLQIQQHHLGLRSGKRRMNRRGIARGKGAVPSAFEKCG